MRRNETAEGLETLDDLLTRLGGISPKRVRLRPAPGTATERDVLRILDREKRKYELVEGTLVEKVMGAKESFVAVQIAFLLSNWNNSRGDLGMVLGEAGTLRFLKGLVRIPDVSFTLWDRLPGGRVPAEPIPELAPDLAVEVLSPGNTRAEMARKLKEYFLSGVRVVWFVDPVARTVQVYSSPDEAVVFAQGDTLTGGDVLPGFRLPVSRLFEKLPDEPARPSRKKKSR